MEFFAGKSLYHWLINCLKPVDFAESVARKVFQQICEGLCHMHSRGILHRDIKLDNILAAQDPENPNVCHTKIIDFGFATLLFKGQTSSLTVGSLAFLSPEILNKQPHDARTDVWSLGIVFFNILSGRMPFIEQTPQKTIVNIKYKELNFQQPCWAKVSQLGKDLVGKMLAKKV